MNINDENEYYISQKNINDYKQYLLYYNWDALYLLNDPHDSFELFIKILENAKEKFRCKKKLNTKKLYKNKCWLFHGLIKCIIKKKLIYKFKINKYSINEIIYKEYNRIFPKFLSKLKVITIVSISLTIETIQKKF